LTGKSEWKVIQSYCDETHSLQITMNNGVLMEVS
jgi:hypothetical protein